MPKSVTNEVNNAIMTITGFVTEAADCCSDPRVQAELVTLYFEAADDTARHGFFCLWTSSFLQLKPQDKLKYFTTTILHK